MQAQNLIMHLMFVISIELPRKISRSAVVGADQGVGQHHMQDKYA